MPVTDREAPVGMDHATRPADDPTDPASRAGALARRRRAIRDEDFAGQRAPGGELAFEAEAPQVVRAQELRCPDAARGLFLDQGVRYVDGGQHVGARGEDALRVVMESYRL